MVLGAEAAADVVGERNHVRTVEAEALAERVAEDVDAPDAGPDVQRLLVLFPLGEGGPGLHRRSTYARQRQLLSHLDRRRAGKTPPSEPAVRQRRGLQGDLVQVDLDRLDRILRLVLRLGRDQGDGVAFETHLVLGEHRTPDGQRLLRVGVRHIVVRQAELPEDPCPDDAGHARHRRHVNLEPFARGTPARRMAMWTVPGGLWSAA